MATDLDKSDTDDHERPAPPKRQCTRLASNNETHESPNKGQGEPEEYDEEERLAREKLSIWQECQVAKGFLDNTINCVVEDYILNPPVTYLPAQDSQFRLFRSNEMEDTAVTMAIRNHGLVCTAPCVDLVPGVCWSNEEDRSLPTNRCPPPENLPGSSAIFDPLIDPSIDPRVGASPWNEDKMDETNREQDFLERAVEEAIKKKGLSALSVDYG